MQVISEYFLLFCSISCLGSCIVLNKDLKKNEALLLISKIPTFSLKKIKVSSQLSIFLLFGIVVVFISLIFFTFESLLIIGGIYLLSIPLSFYFYKQTAKKINSLSEEDHEDIL